MPSTYKISIGKGSLYLQVLIPWTGEPQLIKSLLMLRAFSDKNKIQVDIQIFAGYENRKVHQLIYDEVGFSTVPSIKLDGDMCLEDFHRLTDVLDQVEANSISIVPVYCHILRRKIYGIHVFGKDVKELEAGDDIFPDRYQWDLVNLVGLKFDTFASHCAAPSKNQIDNFIAHRLRKFIVSKFRRLDYLHLVLRALFVNCSAALRVTKIMNTAMSITYKDLNDYELHNQMQLIMIEFENGG